MVYGGQHFEKLTSDVPLPPSVAPILMDNIAINSKAFLTQKADGGIVAPTPAHA
jgi:hypothetical protein